MAIADTYGTGQQPPYYVHRSPRGAVVVCRAHIVTNELKASEAEALAAALNQEFEARMAP